MAISKITYKSSPSATPETWMDVTGATAAASDITAPKTAMLADGVITTGTGSGGGGIDWDAYFNRTIPVTVALPTATQLYGYSFYNSQVLESIDAPTVTRIGQRDFAYCRNLRNINMPNLIYAADTLTADASILAATACYAFTHCDKLGVVNLPKLQKCG